MFVSRCYSTFNADVFKKRRWYQHIKNGGASTLKTEEAWKKSEFL